jgi:3-carboxy-cis,cis-muconate cycloisomerase
MTCWLTITGTHLQHALPVTFGYKCAVYLASLDRHAERLAQLRPRALLASIGGASGSLGSMGMGTGTSLPDGIRTISAICKRLGLTEPPICIHVTRDHIVETISFLAAVCGSLGKIAYDVMLMSSVEIAEVKEPFVPHRGASSTMPHKRNPISSEIVMAIARLTRSHVATARIRSSPTLSAPQDRGISNLSSSQRPSPIPPTPSSNATLFSTT